MTQLPKIEYLRKYFVHKFQDGNGRNRVPSHFEILNKMFSYNFILGYQVIKITTISVFDTCSTIRIFVWITQTLFQKTKKWNLAVNFNCQGAKIITLL